MKKDRKRRTKPRKVAAAKRIARSRDSSTRDGDGARGAYRYARVGPIRVATMGSVRSRFKESLDRGIRKNIDVLKALADW